jgi:glycosyltransferase 2 family protein
VTWRVEPSDSEFFRRLRARPFISLGIGVAAVAVLLFFTDPSRIASEAGKIPLISIALFVASTLGFHLLRSVRWRLLLKAIMGEAEFGMVFWTNMIGYEVNQFIPVRFGGEVTRAYIIDSKKHVGFFPSLSTIAVERILDLLLIAGLGLASAFTYPFISQQFSVMLILLVTAAAAIAMLAVVLIGSRNLPLVMRGFRWLVYHVPLRETWRTKILRVIESSLTGATAIGRDYKLLSISIILSLGIWFVSFLGFYAMLAGVGFEGTAMAILLGIMLFQLTFILPSTPGNVGTWEALFLFSFTAIGLTTLPASPSLLAIVFVTHAFNLIIVALLGTAGIGLLGLKMGAVFRIPGMMREEAAVGHPAAVTSSAPAESPNAST